MARRCIRATSRFTAAAEPKLGPRSAASVVCLCFALLVTSTAEEGLYTASHQIILLTPENVRSVLVNSSAAIVVEFYASWCGHCIAFSPVYKSLARDMKEWKPAVDLAAIDCAADLNRKVCSEYGITGYPTLKFFHAYSKADSKGEALIGFPRDVQGLRHKIIDRLESHTESWPPACPPLEPASQAEIDSFFETNNVQHLALIFEDSKSYIGREVTLDLLQFENIAVRRVQSSEESLVTHLRVTEFPSCYLYYPGGNFTKLKVNIEARAFYSYALRRLPGVVRSGKAPSVIIDVIANRTMEAWRPFSRSSVYMADLESTLHYSMRMELAAHSVFKGDALVSLKKYISVLAKYFPGRPVVMNLLKSVNSWLQNQTAAEVPYEAFKDILDNSAQAPNAALPEGVSWVGCQGSLPHLRRYPCGLWTLFHVLTVQAKKSGGSEPLEVLNAMRGYIHSFFGCRACAEHFEGMAKESLMEVNTLSAAILWLWSRHNLVNNRLAGALSEDPKFPKIQWPSPDMCPACHKLKSNGDHKWSEVHVVSFLMSHFSSNNILTDYLEDESQILEKQRERQAKQQQQALEAQNERIRKARDAMASQPPSSQPTVQEEEEEQEEEGLQDEGEEVLEGAAVADEIQDETSEPTPWAKPKAWVGRSRRRANRKPSIVGMRMRDLQEDIVDLDSFVNQHYKAKALQVDASSQVKQRTLQRKDKQDQGSVFRLGLELDPGLRMAGKRPMEPDLEVGVGLQRKNLQKRELTGQSLSEETALSHGGRWMSALSIGFSKVDVSLCVILYFLSSMCLLTMYLFFKTRLRLRRAKAALP